MSNLGPALIGLIGVPLGIVLANWLNQRAEQRRAEREEQRRRRIRGEEVASELIRVCYEAFDAALASEVAEDARSWPRKPEEAEELTRLSERRDTLIHQLRSRGQEIPVSGVREILADVITCFESYSSAVEMGEGNPSEILAVARNVGIEVLRAYLHGEPMPDTGRVASIASVIKAYWEDRIETEQRFREEERQRRAQEREQAQPGERA